MKKRVIAAFLCFISLSFKSDLLNENILFKCPFRRGIFIKRDENLITEKKIINPTRPIELFGLDSAVYSASKGVVKRIILRNGKFLIFITDRNYTISYENLDSVYVFEKQSIPIGKLIGIANDKRIELAISKGKLELSHPESLLNCECKQGNVSK
ncbi:MAG TPA: hypothetical protein VGM30_12635 [Puia sp.]|jgi:hypothetical protein